jgi:hypothetical protein
MSEGRDRHQAEPVAISPRAECTAVEEVGSMQHFRFGALSSEEVDRLATDFVTARPFPHVVIDDAIGTPPEAVLASFPAPDSPLWRHLDEAYQPGKMVLSRIERIPTPLSAMLRQLMEPAALGFFERVSGITSLLPDPYMDGGGLHSSPPGGVMAPHTDTHINQRLGIYRRLNVLVYLNPEWSESDGGCLELYDESNVHQPVRTVVPRWGTMVIFRSDSHSVHGFTKAIANTRGPRRALASYYYTAVDGPEFAGYGLTHWRKHQSYWERDGGLPVMRRARLQAYRMLRLGSKALAYLAHRAGPRNEPVR